MIKHCRKLLSAVILTSPLLALSSANASTLLEIYDQALTNDHTYKAAQAGYAAGRESRNIGRAGLLPTINASASWTDSSGDTTYSGPVDTGAGITYINDQKSSSDSTRTGYEVALVQPLFNMALWQNYQLSKATGDIAKAQYRMAEQKLIIRVAEAYFNALQAVDNLQTARAEENALSHQLEQTRQRFEVGLTAITEVHEAQAVFDSSMAERIIAEGLLGIAFEALEVITGQPYNELAPLRDDVPVALPVPQERNAWVDLALNNNFSLQTQELTAETARRAAAAQKAGHYPTVTGRLGLSDYDTNAGEGFDETDTNNQGTSIGITVSVPIFNGGGTSASRRKAQQEYIQAKEILKQTQRDIVQVTRSLHLTVVTSVTTVKARNQAITSNQSALEATQAGYDVGTRDLVDVLNAQRNLYRAQRNYLDSLYTYILTSLRLKESAGTLSAVDITELNQWLDFSRTASRM